MRLVDIVNQARHKASEGTNFVRYPVQMISQALRRVGQQWYENLQVPGKEKKPSGDLAPQTPAKLETTTAPATYRSPVDSGTRQSSAPPNCSPESQFSLQPGTVIKSRWNSYTIGTCFASSGNTCLYDAKTRSNEPVLIKEYQLIEYDSNSHELEERQQTFERLIELNQKIGHGPDFRIVKLIDAVSLARERKCYLVTKPICCNTTLETYLSRYGLMTAKQVREVLRQVLESLRFLHTAYRVHFSSSESERGLPHGNLSLKSLLVRQIDADVDRQIFIYLSDLELWEHFFYLPASERFRHEIAKSTRDLGSVERDLADLGLISLHLVDGTLTSTLERTDEQEQQILCDLNDLPLLHFIQRLLGLSSPFSTAEEALHTLLQLPEPSQVPVLTTLAETPLEESRATNQGGLSSAIALLALGLGVLIIWLTHRHEIFNVVTSPSRNAPQASRIADVTAPPSLTYTIEPKGAWHYAMARQFTSNVASGRNVSQGNLLKEIENRHLNLAIKPLQSASSSANVLSHLTSGEADVAFMSQPDISLKSLGLEQQPVAYDALVVFVPFSDPYHFQKSIAVQELNRSITIEKLRQLYTGDTATPLLLPGKQFRAKLFFSEDEEVVQRFKSQVLNNDLALVAKFDRLRVKVKARDEKAAAADRAPLDVYNRIWSDANRTGSEGIVVDIGFDRLGRMFDQCSVYPLAVGREGTEAVQVLVRSNGNSIDQDPHQIVDLCGAKGSYLPNVQNYPLRYSLDIVFHRNSQAGLALAKMLKTTEGKYLMSEVGLIPEEPMLALLSAVWGSTND